MTSLDKMTKGSLWVVTAESIGPTRTPKDMFVLLTHNREDWDKYGNIPCQFFGGDLDDYTVVSSEWLHWNAQKIV